MKKTPAKKYVFGEYLKELREKKGVSLKEVEKAIGASNAYISQLETGTRKKLPEPDRLRKIADYYNVSVNELLQKAGYFQAEDIPETFKQVLDKRFLHVINDPQFHTGQRIDPDEVSPDIKRFVIEMHAYNLKKGSFYIHPQAAGRVIENNRLKSLTWKTSAVTRDVYQVDGKSMLRYRVQVICIETEGDINEEKFYCEGPKPGSEKVTQKATGEGICQEDADKVSGYEASLLLQATENALRNALPKIQGTKWDSIIKPAYREQ